MKVLFICKGNINRSALAEYILRDYLHDVDGVEIVSAGTHPAFGSWGAKATKKMRTLAKEKGVSSMENHRAQPVTKELIESADRVFYMDRKNERKLKKLFGVDFVDQHCKILRDGEIPDPMGGTLEDFELAYQLIRDKCWYVSQQIRHSLKCGEDLPLSKSP